MACLAVSVGVLAGSLRTAAALERDWAAEAERQKVFNAARGLELKLQSESLMRLRQLQTQLDRMGAE